MVSSSDRVFFGGFASGLDTAGLIDSLVAAQQRPILGLLDRVDRIESRQSAFGQINTRLANLLTQLASLRDPTTIGARSASTSQLASEAQKLSASASSSAAFGSFTVDVVSLATATEVGSTQAVGLAVDSAAALDKAGFALPFTYGTFSVNGTVFTTVDAQATTATSTAAIGATVNATATLDSAGLTVAPAASGTFSVNGTAINYDATVDSLTDIMLRISGSAAGVTATYDATARTVTLTADAAGPAAITLSDDAGNFLTAVDVLSAVQTAGRNASTLTSVMADINGAGIGVTATLENDALARPNLLKLDGGASAVQLGSGADTSNFLAATQLLQSPTGTARTSVRSMGVLNPSADLSSARIGLPVALLIVAFTFFRLLLRSVSRRMVVREIGPAELASAGAYGALPAPAMAGAGIGAGSGAAQIARAGTAAPLAPMEDQRSEMELQVSKLAKEHPDTVAGVVQSWLRED